MTVLDRRPAGFTPGVPEVLEALDRAAAAQAEAAHLIQEIFGPDGSRVRAHHAGRGGLGVTGRFIANDGGGGSFVDRVPDDLAGLAGADPAGADHTQRHSDLAGSGEAASVGAEADPVSVVDLRSVLAKVNRVNAGADRVQGVCSEMIFAGADPCIPKPERIHDLLGERSPEAAVKKYLLATPKMVRDLKSVRTATNCFSFTINAHPALLPVLAEAVTSGVVTLGQAEAITSCLTGVARRKTGVDVDALDTVESILVGHATGGRYGTPPETIPVTGLINGHYGLPMHPEELHRLGKQLAELVDEDGPEPADNAVHHQRGLTLKPGKKPGDPAELRAKLTPEAYEQLTGLLAAILDPKTGTQPGDTGTNDDGGGGTGMGNVAGPGNASDDSGGITAGAAGGPVSPFVLEPADGFFRMQGEDPVTFPQAQHDAFVTLLGLAAKTAPDQGGAPPRVILLARAEQVLKALTHTPHPGQAEPGRITGANGTSGSRGRSGRSQAVRAVDEAITAATRTLAEAGRAGFLTDEAITTINTLITLLNTDHALRSDDPTTSLHHHDNPADEVAHGHTAGRNDPGEASQGTDTTGACAGLHAEEPGSSGSGCASDRFEGVDVSATGCIGKDGSAADTNPTTPPPDPVPGQAPPTPPPVFGASMFQDPRLLTSALLPATGETIPLSRLGAILCDAIIEIVTTKHGELLDYTVAQHRTFTPNQRRILLSTYTTCAVPGCHIPGLRCDAHHVIPAAKNGPTSISNGILLCRHHHTKLHQGHLTLHPRQPGIPGLNATDNPNTPPRRQ